MTGKRALYRRKPCTETPCSVLYLVGIYTICKKEFSDITEDDLTDFIKSTIHNLGLTKKSYAGLRTLVRGIFKYGKDKKYTSLSMTQFFGDLELPNNIFEKRIINKETEVFNEDEIPVVISYLRNHADIWNLGLLLQF